jgi:hypothetical protein
VDFSQAVNPIVVGTLGAEAGLLPTWLSTPVHNLHVAGEPWAAS